MNRGEPTWSTWAIFALTVTSWVFVLVLQTQIAYVAVLPGRTWVEFEKGCTDTHS